MSRADGRTSPVSAVILLVVLTSLFTLPAGAQEEGEESTTTTTTIQVTPAVPIETPTTTPAQADWTYRFLIPTGLVLVAVVILMTSIRYFTNVVRKRYRIVEE